MTPSSLRKTILVPILLGFVVLVAASLLAMNGIQRTDLQEDVAAGIDAVQAQLEARLESDANFMVATADLLSRDPRLRDAMRRGSRDSLLEQSVPVFQSLRSAHSITHLYFLDSERRTVLRVHRPELRGDVINRFTTREAEAKNQTVFGLELGRYLGLLTLRAVTPWHVDGEPLG